MHLHKIAILPIGLTFGGPRVPQVRERPRLVAGPAGEVVGVLHNGERLGRQENGRPQRDHGRRASLYFGLYCTFLPVRSEMRRKAQNVSLEAASEQGSLL